MPQHRCVLHAALCWCLRARQASKFLPDARTLIQAVADRDAQIGRLTLAMEYLMERFATMQGSLLNQVMDLQGQLQNARTLVVVPGPPAAQARVSFESLSAHCRAGVRGVVNSAPRAPMLCMSFMQLLLFWLLSRSACNSALPCHITQLHQNCARSYGTNPSTQTRSLQVVGRHHGAVRLVEIAPPP